MKVLSQATDVANSINGIMQLGPEDQLSLNEVIADILLTLPLVTLTTQI